MVSSQVSGLRSVALNIADIDAAEDFFVRVWHLCVTDRLGDAVYLRAAGTDHHVLSLHKADKTTLRNITFRANSAEDLERIAAATKAAWHDRVASGAGGRAVRRYSEHGIHVTNVVIDGLIDSPGTRALPRAHNNPDIIINPMKIAEAFYYLHTQDKSCWTHELQLTPFPTKPSH
jgi:hypothetical protein